MQTYIKIISVGTNVYGDAVDLVDYLFKRTQSYTKTKEILKQQYGIIIELGIRR